MLILHCPVTLFLSSLPVRERALLAGLPLTSTCTFSFSKGKCHLSFQRVPWRSETAITCHIVLANWGTVGVDGWSCTPFCTDHYYIEDCRSWNNRSHELMVIRIQLNVSVFLLSFSFFFLLFYFVTLFGGHLSTEKHKENNSRRGRNGTGALFPHPYNLCIFIHLFIVQRVFECEWGERMSDSQALDFRHLYF